MRQQNITRYCLLLIRPPIGDLFRSLCLYVSHVVYCDQTVQDRPIVCAEVDEISIHAIFDPLVELGEGSKLDVIIAAKRWHIEQNFVLRVIGSRGWALDTCESQPANALLTPKIGDLKTPPLNYGQAVQTEQHFEVIDRGCEVTVVVNARKYSLGSH